MTCYLTGVRWSACSAELHRSKLEVQSLETYDAEIKKQPARALDSSTVINYALVAQHNAPSQLRLQCLAPFEDTVDVSSRPVSAHKKLPLNAGVGVDTIWKPMSSIKMPASSATKGL
ncbi:hypothetical protein VTO73DRAFT_6486 [Trametes versicolor]